MKERISPREIGCIISKGYSIIDKIKEELRKQGWSEERINKELGVVEGEQK